MHDMNGAHDEGTLAATQPHIRMRRNASKETQKKDTHTAATHKAVPLAACMAPLAYRPTARAY